MKSMAASRRTAAVLCLFLPSLAIAATTVRYEALDLVDTVVGEDLWQYDYTVSGSFAQGFSFEIVFDAHKVTSLEDAPAAPNPDWSVFTIPALPQVPADGIYSAQATAPDPSLATPFRVSFIWNGPGVPQAQAFNVFDDGFNQIGAGNTAPIPEPHTYGLMGAGLLLLMVRLRTRRAR